jgi:predicted transposase YbfD/YdcC
LRGAFFPSAHRTTDKSNGRLQTHRILCKTVTAREIDFPFASQIFLLRRTREFKGEKSEETICGITSRASEQAGPHDLLRHNREHWGIENKLHHTRDTTYNEDRSRIRKPKGARSLASLKNLAIGLHALEIFKPPGARRETIPKMNRRITRNPQIAVNFCITPCNKHLL